MAYIVMAVWYLCGKNFTILHGCTGDWYLLLKICVNGGQSILVLWRATCWIMQLDASIIMIENMSHSMHSSFTPSIMISTQRSSCLFSIQLYDFQIATYCQCYRSFTSAVQNDFSTYMFNWARFTFFSWGCLLSCLFLTLLNTSKAVSLFHIKISSF